jgi:hypothetical protein
MPIMDLIFLSLLLLIVGVYTVALFRRKSFVDILRDIPNEIQVINQIYSESIQGGEGVIIDVNSFWDYLFSNPRKLKFYRFDCIKESWNKIPVCTVSPKDEFNNLNLEDFNLSQIQALNQDNKYIPVVTLFKKNSYFWPFWYKQEWFLSLYPRSICDSLEDFREITACLEEMF